VLNELEKKRRQSEFDHDYYIDVATGEVKKRLYVKSNQGKRKSRSKKRMKNPIRDEDYKDWPEPKWN
jgi:hypothetical protein